MLWALLTLLGLVSPNVGLLLQKLDFCRSKTELDHRRHQVWCIWGQIDNVDQILLLGPAWKVPCRVWQPFQGHSNRSCHYCSNFKCSLHVSLKFLSHKWWKNLFQDPSSSNNTSNTLNKHKCFEILYDRPQI